MPIQILDALLPILFYANVPRKAIEKSPMTYVLATYRGDTDESLGSCFFFLHQPWLLGSHVGGEPADGRSASVCVSSSLCHPSKRILLKNFFEGEIIYPKVYSNAGYSYSRKVH